VNCLGAMGNSRPRIWPDGFTPHTFSKLGQRRRHSAQRTAAARRAVAECRGGAHDTTAVRGGPVRGVGPSLYHVHGLQVLHTQLSAHSASVPVPLRSRSRSLDDSHSPRRQRSRAGADGLDMHRRDEYRPCSGSDGRMVDSVQLAADDKGAVVGNRMQAPAFGVHEVCDCDTTTSPHFDRL
jgi:hypothetical protein